MVHTRRLDYSLVDGLLNGEGTSDLLEYILQNSPLHPEDIDYFIGKVVEILCSVQSPEKQNEAARILEPVWALVSNTEIGAERAKHLLIPLLQLGSDSQYGVANLNWIFHIINILLLKVESLDDIFEDSSVSNAVQSLGRTLVDTGDYETQLLIVEAMFYITKHGIREVWAKNWFPTQCAFDAFMHFDASNFEIECRKLLNNLNEGCDKQKVFSVIAQSVIFGESKVQKPPGQELWVNFNFDSKCISFYCVCPSEVEKVQENLKILWETILIYANNVDSSLLTFFPTHGLQELVIKLNCPCASLINASSNGLIKGNTIYFLFEEFLDIQAYVAAVFGEMFQNADEPGMKSLDIPCEHNKSQTEGNRKTQNSGCKASEAAAVIHIGQTSNHIGEPSMNMSSCGVICEKLHTEETDGTDMNEDSGYSSSKVLKTAAIIPTGQCVNRVAVPCRTPSDQAAECDSLHTEKEMVDGTVMNKDLECSSSKVSQTSAIIPIGQSINKIAVQRMRPLDQAAESVTHHSEKAEGTNMNADSQCSSFKASQTATSIRVGETLNSAEIQNTGVMGNTTENSKCSPLPRNASVNGGSSLSSVSLCKASQSNNCIAIDDVANANKVVRCSTLSARNHHYVRQVKLNNVFEQSSSKSSGSIMNSPMSQDEQPQNLNMGLSESKYSKASFSPTVKILHFPKTPKETTSPVKNKTNETSHEQPLLQTASSEILNAAEVCSQSLREHGDKAHVQVDGIQVEASEQFKKQSAFVQLPENVNASTAENNINTNSSYEHTKPPTEKNVKLQKDILLECSPVVNLQKENVNKMKKKTIQKKPEIYLETDMLLECNNVTEKENKQLCDETAEVRPKKHKLFSNNSRANTELLLNNNTTLIEENEGNAIRLAKSTYLENISKRQNAKRRKLKSKTAPLSSKVQHDNSFIDGEGIHSKEPQIQLNDVATGNQPKEKNTTNLEKDNEKTPAAVPSAKLSPKVNFDKSSNSKSGVADSGVGTSVSAEKSSSPGEPVTRRVSQKRLKRKVTNKADGGNKNDSGYSGRKSRKAALDSIKKTKKIMKYSEENSSVELSLPDFSDSEDFVPNTTKKRRDSVSKKSVNKSNVYSLTESDANSGHSSSNRRSHVSLFESPVKSYKQWREKQRLRRKTSAKNERKSKTDKKARHLKGSFLEDLGMNSFRSKVSKTYHTLNKQNDVKKNILSDFDLLLGKSTELSDIESFKLVVERSTPTYQKNKPPKSLNESSKLPLWSPFRRNENTSKDLNTLKNLGNVTPLGDSHRTYNVKNQVNSGMVLASNQFPTQSTNSEKKKHDIQEIKNINHVQKIVVEADIEDPKEKLKLLRKKYRIAHKLKNQNTKVGSPYNDQINFIEIESSKENSYIDAFHSGSMPSTLENERLHIEESSSESSIVEMTRENVEFFGAQQQPSQSHGNNIHNYLADADISNMCSGKKYHLERYLMDVATSRSPVKIPHIQTKSEQNLNLIDLSGSPVISSLSSKLKRKCFDFCQEAQASNSKLVKLSDPKGVEKPSETVKQKRSTRCPKDSFSDYSIQSATKMSENISSISKSVVQSILEKYNKRGTKGEAAGTLLGNTQGDAYLSDQKSVAHHSSITGDNVPFPTPFTKITHEFNNENKFQEMPVVNETHDPVTSVMQPLILEKAFGEILELSKKYVNSVLKYNAHFCKQLAEHRKSMATAFFGDKFASRMHPHLDEISDDPLTMSEQFRENLNNHIKDLRSILVSFQEAEKNFEAMLKCTQEKVALKYDSSVQEVLVKTQAELERKILNDVQQHLSKFELKLQCCLFD